MHHPWRAFSALTDWTLIIGDLPHGQHGEACYRSRTVTLRSDLLQVERRVTICHEVRHIMRGPTPVEPVMRAREEAVVQEETARLLIDMHALGEAMAWSEDPHEIADELQVTVECLWTRMETLQFRERAYLHRRLENQ